LKDGSERCERASDRRLGEHVQPLPPASCLYALHRPQAAQRRDDHCRDTTRDVRHKAYRHKAYVCYGLVSMSCVCCSLNFIRVPCCSVAPLLTNRTHTHTHTHTSPQMSGLLRGGLFEHRHSRKLGTGCRERAQAAETGRSYVTCITIIDTIIHHILTNYTNNAYTYDTYLSAGWLLLYYVSQ
jgi:hypothetical protein